ncbi:MAG: PDZ domain-containing protein, partial [Bacteroidota bacterium]|nr:PDZ domain-containing protein [Bacteroidota bacterium]
MKVVKLIILFCLIQPSFLMAQELKVDSVLMDYNVFFKKMDQNFVDEINAEEFIVRVKKATVKQLDPHSHFYTKEESISRNNAWKGISYAGIGASVKESTNGVMIEYCKKGYGASEQGLLPGDIIIQIDSTYCKGLSFEQVISLLRGRNHSKVQVAVKRGEQKITRTIERNYIISKSISFADTISKGIGLIKVDQFLRGSGEEFRRQVKKVVE